MSFENKVILVTGSGSGIGAETARHLARLGGKVALVDLNEERLKEVAEQIKKAGSTTPLTILADVTKDAQRIIDETIKHFGQLDVLVNNAGVLNRDSIDEFNVGEFDRVLNVNVRSVLILMNLAVPHLEKTKGNIVNISSVAGLKAVKKLLSYCISKSAVVQLTKCAALDLSDKGIRVNAINPGITRTPLWQSIGIKPNGFDNFVEENRNKWLINRVGEVSDISTAIAYLASDSASFLTGITLPVDGGYMIANT